MGVSSSEERAKSVFDSHQLHNQPGVVNQQGRPSVERENVRAALTAWTQSREGIATW